MKYGKEVKEETVLMILNGQSTIKKMAEDLGVHYTTVRDLKKSVTYAPGLKCNLCARLNTEAGDWAAS